MELDFIALEARWMDRSLADLAQLRRVDSLTGAEVVGRKNGNYAGILIPSFHTESGHIRDYRLRRDHPDIEYDPAGNLKEKVAGSFMIPAMQLAFGLDHGTNCARSAFPGAEA